MEDDSCPFKVETSADSFKVKGIIGMAASFVGLLLAATRDRIADFVSSWTNNLV
jgi:hypothetical protein